MGFEMIRGSKDSWARTRTSERATPDSEPDYLGEREDAFAAQEIASFAPEQAQKWMKTGFAAAWKIVNVDYVVLIAKFLVRG
jgi:hypothetical protein